jgi:hypothetical protein
LYAAFQNDPVNGVDYIGLMDPCKCKNLRDRIEIYRMLLAQIEAREQADGSSLDPLKSVNDAYSYALFGNGALDAARELTKAATQSFPGGALRNIRRAARTVNRATGGFAEFAEPVTKNLTGIGYAIDTGSLIISVGTEDWNGAISKSAAIGLNFTGPLGRVAGFAGQQIIDYQVTTTEDALDELDASGERLIQSTRRLNLTMGIHRINELLKEYKNEGCGP